MSNSRMIDVDDVALPQRLQHLRERSPHDVERQVMALSADSPRDELCAALDAAEWLMCRARTIDRLLKQIAIAWIDKNGDFSIGNMHYAVGYSLSVKCLNVLQTGHAVLDAAGGELDQFIHVLVAQPFKHASVRNVIGKRLHDQLFSARRTGRLINGVPERVLKRMDQRFSSDQEA